MALMRSREEAVDIAKEVADFFGRPYVVYVDSEGNWNLERCDENAPPQCSHEVFYPRRK